MSLDELLAKRVEDAVRKVLDEQLPQLELRLAAAQAPDSTDDRALTVEEAARFSGYTAETIMERIRGGDLRGHKPKGSREWRVRQGDLKSWLYESAGAKVLDIGELSAKMLGRGGGTR